jgi:hypothetical protein
LTDKTYGGKPLWFSSRVMKKLNKIQKIPDSAPPPRQPFGKINFNCPRRSFSLVQPIKIILKKYVHGQSPEQIFLKNMCMMKA